jgi:hypothetical protein
MKKQTGKMSDLRAIERWENEGGEIPEIILLNLKETGYEDGRETGKAIDDSFKKLLFVKRRGLGNRKNR